MNKTINTAVLFLLVQPVIAQKGIDNLIQAEKKFAAYSVAHSTKEAFQQFIDSNSIMFEKGQAVKAIDFWNKREKRPGVLNWRPRYAEIAASGDFGYTTGPWTFQNSPGDTIIARGQYTTVWYLDKKGEWKFLADLGVDDTPPDTDTASCFDLALLRSDPAFYSEGLKSLLKTENEFIKRTTVAVAKGWPRKEWYRRNYSETFILNRNGRLPARDYDPFLGVMNQMPAEVEYKILGSGIASSGDIGYVYGRTIIAGKEDNYLRIWRREREGWKIALEVLRY